VFLVTEQHELSFNYTYAHHYEKLGVTVYRPYLSGIKPINTKKFLDLIVPYIETAIISRPDVFKKFYPWVKSINPKCTIIYDMVDFHYIRYLREYKLSNSEHALQEAEKYKILEKENCLLANITYVVSETDKQLLFENNISCNKIVVVSNIHDSKPIEKSFNPFEKRKDLLFIGGFQHTPNIDSVIYLRNKILPLIWKTDPSIKIHIIGSKVPENIRALENPNFIIHGYIKNIDSFFYNSKIFLAPLQFGAGIKGKIGQSLEYNLPLITTDIGAEGFNFSPYQNLMIANSPEQIAKNVLEVYNDKNKWTALSQHAKNIIKPFSYSNTKKTVEKSLKKNSLL
jgi:hypothetical protein